MTSESHTIGGTNARTMRMPVVHLARSATASASHATTVTGYDPAYYDNPHEIRFDRKAPHISLGGGIHKCLGMHLARRELQIAIEEFTAAIPEFRIRDGFKVPFHVGNILHVEDLPLVWN